MVSHRSAIDACTTRSFAFSDAMSDVGMLEGCRYTYNEVILDSSWGPEKVPSDLTTYRQVEIIPTGITNDSQCPEINSYTKFDASYYARPCKCTALPAEYYRNRGGNLNSSDEREKWVCIAV
jgi:hypothetical protein